MNNRGYFARSKANEHRNSLRRAFTGKQYRAHGMRARLFG